MFVGDARLVSIAINTIQNGVLEGQRPEQMAATIIYEIDGRGRGWAPMMNYALVEHFGLPNHQLPRGLQFDPALEIAVSNVVGGIHLLFEAADNGQDAMRDFFNCMIGTVNCIPTDTPIKYGQAVLHDE